MFPSNFQLKQQSKKKKRLRRGIGTSSFLLLVPNFLVAKLRGLFVFPSLEAWLERNCHHRTQQTLLYGQEGPGTLCSRNFKNVKLRSTMWNSRIWLPCHPILRDINFGKIWTSKIAFLQFYTLWTLNFGKSWTWKLLKFTKIPNSESQKLPKITFWPFQITKVWFNVKFEWQ